MSNEDDSNTKFILDIIGFVVGLVIYFISVTLIISWDEQREGILQNSTPGEVLYVLIPIFVGLLTFGTVLVAQGAITIGGYVLTQVSEQQNEISG